MSDIDTSGAPTTAPAATAGTTPPMASSAPQPIGSFGSTRGSGLARGKRPTPAGAPAAGAAASSGYTPSALEVIRPQSEYKNPFTGETSVAAPVVNEPAPQAAPNQTPVAFQPSTPIARPTSAPAAASAPSGTADELFPFNPNGSTDRAPAANPAAAEKPELKILPPAETKRPATNWESGPSAADDRRNERPTFRPERRESKPFQPREGKPFEARDPKPFAPREAKPFAPREPRDPRRDQRQGEPRSQQTQQPYAPRAPRTEELKKTGGFFAWLKGIFSGAPAAETAPTNRSEGEQRRDRDGDFNRDGQRRRHRGGRGRGGFQGENRGPGDGQPYQHRDPRDEPSSPQDGGERGYQGGGGESSYREGGGGRRRRRGGRGRFRGEGGSGNDRGNDPSPEGQQGGGAI